MNLSLIHISANGYAGYPVFNSPDEIAGTFKSAGFDMVVTANNHILDRGYQGALRTLEVLAQNGLDTVGVYPSLEKSQEFLIKDLKGIRVGYLGYTYSTNGKMCIRDSTRRGKVRRARLFYLRDRVGKKARVKEKGRY